jgi:polygalacturonase
MFSIWRIPGVALLCLSFLAAVQAQDTRTVSEPKFPSVCKVFRAPLMSSPAGPVVGSSVAEQDLISRVITHGITRFADLNECQGKAIEFALGFDTRYNAFLINPITFPPGVSLIIDGGVTVYGSRNPDNYQISGSDFVCGTLAVFGSDKTTSDACQALLTFQGNDRNEAQSGLYGYGVIDGQGQLPMLFSTPPAQITPDGCPLSDKVTFPTWWDLINAKDNCSDKSNVNENSPFLVSAGAYGSNGAGDFTIYKVTIRNPPFHNVEWGGIGLTVWGAHIQAPWNVPNTDGLNLHGSKISVYNTIVSNGDDDITFGTAGENTTEITIKNFSAYSRDGLTIFGNGGSSFGVSNLEADNVIMTGDLPSVDTTTGTVNGVSEDTMQNKYGVGYARALPNAGGDVHGLNIKWDKGSSISKITFHNVCLQDIKTPLNIEQEEQNTAAGKLDSILLENIHVLPPNLQFLFYNSDGSSQGPGSGLYYFNFQGFAGSQGNPPAAFALSNVVFDDVTTTGTLSLYSIVATNNFIGTVTNVYPAIFNQLAPPVTPPPPPPPAPIKVFDIENNQYSSRTSTSTPSLAAACSTSLPFITGDLYASAGTVLATGDATNLNAFTARAGSTITLHAVVQPIMSQTTYPMWGKEAKNTIVAIGSPSLTNAVRFYDGTRYIGSAGLSTNGTLATLQINRITPGWHIYTAQYPKDAFYSNLSFGPVVVKVAQEPLL